MKLPSAKIFVAGLMLAASPAFAAHNGSRMHVGDMRIALRPTSAHAKWKPTSPTAKPTGRLERRRPRAAEVITATDTAYLARSIQGTEGNLPAAFVLKLLGCEPYCSSPSCISLGP